ncbi:M42 family metallopeptidase [Pseudoneobacillus sp. C159]
MMKIDDTVQLLKELVQIPSPAGNTYEVMNYIEKYLLKFNVESTRTRKGGLIVTIPGEDVDHHRLVTAHVDTLGAIVKEIKPSGRLKLDRIGGFSFNSVEGEYCQIQTRSGKIYTGTILMHQTSLHVYRDMEGKLERNQVNMEIRLDEDVYNPEEVRQLGIEVGDFISFDPRFHVNPSGYIKSRHLDDKAAVAVLLELIKQVKQENLILPYTTHFLISNAEEIYYGGNSNISPETVEYLALDLGVTGDGQTSDEKSVSICAKDMSGPYHYQLRNHLIQLAEENGISYKVDIYPNYGSDAAAAIRSGYDIVHGLIGPGVDASHAYERTHISAIENTAKLLYHYIQSNMVL